jgi:putative IMPACT (imprinted ancient) family translation regulator
MKRILVLSTALVFGAAAAALATPQKAQANTGGSHTQATAKDVRGTVSQLDLAARTMKVKEASGNEVTVRWDESTRMGGELKEGATVSVETARKGGETIATSIMVDAKKSY